jgi:hypothetical protein
MLTAKIKPGSMTDEGQTRKGDQPITPSCFESFVFPAIRQDWQIYNKAYDGCNLNGPVGCF